MATNDPKELNDKINMHLKAQGLNVSSDTESKISSD